MHTPHDCVSVNVCMCCCLSSDASDCGTCIKSNQIAHDIINRCSAFHLFRVSAPSRPSHQLALLNDYIYLINARAETKEKEIKSACIVFAYSAVCIHFLLFWLQLTRLTCTNHELTQFRCYVAIRCTLYNTTINAKSKNYLYIFFPSLLFEITNLGRVFTFVNIFRSVYTLSVCMCEWESAAVWQRTSE